MVSTQDSLLLWAKLSYLIQNHCYVVEWVVCLPPKVTSLMSLLSAAACTKAPGELLDGVMTQDDYWTAQSSPSLCLCQQLPHLHKMNNDSLCLTWLLAVMNLLSGALSFFTT